MAKVRIRKRGKTYSYIFEAGHVNGKRKVLEKGGFPSADAAYTAGVEAFTDWKHGNIGITSERINLKDFLDLWLKRIEKGVCTNTYQNYKTLFGSMVLPYLGSIVLQDLRPANIDSWLRSLRDKGYAYGSMVQIRRILKTALNYAVYPCELIPSNPCTYTKVPRTTAKTVINRCLVSSSRFHDLLHVYPLGHPLHTPIALFWHTGMRISEALGLTWEDIDFVNKSITIHNQRVPNRKGAAYTRITPTKTPDSVRKIYVTDELLDELAKEYERQKELSIICAVDNEGYCYSFSSGLTLNIEYTPIQLVCVSKHGKPASRNTIMAYLKLQGLNSHSFRHTQATRLAKAKVPPITAARRLGHKNVDTTLNVYTHDTDELQKQAISDLELAEWDVFFST